MSYLWETIEKKLLKKDMIFSRNLDSLSRNIAISGSPGSFKSILCIEASINWVSNNPAKNRVIYLNTEHPNPIMMEQAELLTKKISPLCKRKLIIVNDLFTSDQKEKNQTVNISLIRDGILNSKNEFDIPNPNILLILDSITPLWLRAASTGRLEIGPLKALCIEHACLTIFTNQITEASGKSFGGFGVEHSFDVLIETGSLIENGSMIHYLAIKKARGFNFDHRWFKIKLNIDDNYDPKINSLFLIGDPISIKGTYFSIQDAIEHLRYERSENLQKEHNQLLERQNEILQGILQQLTSPPKLDISK